MREESLDGATSGSERPKHFSAEEVAGLAPELVRMLDRARGLAHIPFHITSGYRPPAQNEVVGGVQDSAHLRGLAVDIACYDSRARMKMVTALIVAGCRRLGVYRSHIHADVDDSLPADVLWFGEE